MRTTIDRGGRIVIPKALRDSARLQPGTVVDIRLRDGVLEIEPAGREVRLTRRGSFTVAVPDEAGPPLTSEAVEETRRRLAEGRG